MKPNRSYTSAIINTVNSQNNEGLKQLLAGTTSQIEAVWVVLVTLRDSTRTPNDLLKLLDKS
jgi:hypothetical protein